MKVKVWLKKNYFHIICVVIALCFLTCSICLFPNAWQRIKESGVDFWNSAKYYVRQLFQLDYGVDVSVVEYSNISKMPLFNMPFDWDTFKLRWSAYWQVFATSDNFVNYIGFLSELLLFASQILMLIVIPIIILMFIYFKIFFSKVNNNYGVDSKPLTFYKWFSSKTLVPIKNFVLRFVDFIKQNKMYLVLWLVIWAWNFNLITIVIEFLAYYFYFVMSFDFKSIYGQFYKLFCDLSVPFKTIPAIFYVLLFIWFVCWFRKKIAYARLSHFERKNCGFINERPIVLMVCGTMGKKKTTAITDMALSQEVMLKDKAFEKILENDLKFPNFSFINFENAIKDAMKQHKIYNLATCRRYVKHLATCFYVSFDVDVANKKAIQRHLREHFNLKYKNLLFDYDFVRYGLFYDDKLKVVDIWSVLETYAQLYFVYIIQSSLIISNYSVRTDNLLEDLGNFPLWNTDFFKRDSRLIDSFSRHAHIIDFDALRLGKKIIADNPKKDSFEFGVINITEVGKERKNQLELKETKKNIETTNQKNDGFTDWLKMIRHSATIDNFPFVKVITDEQRPESLGADARDLCEIVHIRNASQIKLAMPFFNLTELFYDFIFSKFEKLYYKYRFTRGDNTLLMYLLKSFVAKFNGYYNGIYNTFGYCKLDVDVENGTQDGLLSGKNYYLMSKKIYSKRFSTDCFSDYFATKSLKSDIGINDLEEYRTEKATFEELKEQNSYFINDLVNKQNSKED